MKLLTTALSTAASIAHAVTAIPLDINSAPSITNASATLAYGLMSWYQNNQSGTATTAIGTLPSPLYWWEAGAVWGAMIDYWAYTSDTSYNPSVTQALQAQVGPDNNYMPPAYFPSLGNDDQAFWGMAVLTALEYSYPAPAAGQPTWLELAENTWNTQWPRWDTSTCAGGLRWQIFESNAGYNYKNAISNAAFFQMAARLGRYTGNQTYVQWAERSWDWMVGIGLIDSDYNVFDGTDDTINCTQVDHTGWTYNPAALIYGTAMMYNLTNAGAEWEERTSGLLRASVRNFYSMSNATNILYEFACEPEDTCDNDQYSFKAYMARWLAKASVVAPYIRNEVATLLQTSAQAAARACTGGDNGTTCGQKWYVDGYDGSTGVGQELSALEMVQSLLLLRGDANLSHIYPAVAEGVKISQANDSSMFIPNPPRPSSAAAAPTASVSAASAPVGGAADAKSTDANVGYRLPIAGYATWPLLALLACRCWLDWYSVLRELGLA